VSADLEHQVPAVLDLIVGVLILKSASLLLFQIEGETQAGGVNPTLADLAQPPYSPCFGQGVCDLRQACGVRDMSKTVSFLGKADPRLACLASYILMTVQDHLGGEGRMPADLDGDMAPLGVKDMKAVVIHVGHRVFGLDVMVGADISHTGAWARPTKTRNNPWVTFVLAKYSSAMWCLRSPTEQSMTGISPLSHSREYDD